VSNPIDLVLIEGRRIRTARLLLRPWAAEDAAAALAVFGDEQVARWLAPAVGRVPDVEGMRALLARWAGERVASPSGRWAVEVAESGEVVGAVALLPLPPDKLDLEIGWQLASGAWGKGYAAEAGHAVAHYAFASGADEIFAVVRPRNTSRICSAWERIPQECQENGPRGGGPSGINKTAILIFTLPTREQPRPRFNRGILETI